jgi:polyisoprenoid-binding protein YceI
VLGVKSEVKGSFRDFSIKAIKNNNLEKSSVLVEIAANSIDTDNKRRDKHLRSNDFFDIHKFKSITFKSKKITKVKNGIFQIKGDLTIKNKITKLTFEVAANQPDKNKKLWRIKGHTTVSRKAVGLTYVSPFYLPDIYDDIKIVFDVYMTKK